MENWRDSLPSQRKKYLPEKFEKDGLVKFVRNDPPLETVKAFGL